MLVKTVAFYLERFQRYSVLKNVPFLGPPLEHSNLGKKVSIRFDSRYRIDFFYSIWQSDKFAACTVIFK